MKVTKKTVILGLILTLISSAVYFLYPPSNESLRLLAWVGYNEPDLLRDFSKQTGIKVEVTTFIGGTNMVKKLAAQPAGYDVVVLDPEYIKIVAKKKLIQAIDIKQFDLSDFHPFFLKMNQLIYDDSQYAVPVRFGAIGIMYNADRIESQEIESYNDIFKSRFANKISVMDLWQPTMGVMSLSIPPISNDPYNLSEREIEKLNSKMKLLNSVGVIIHKNVPKLVESLSEERTWIMLGGGEANIPALQSRNKNFKWKLPKEGGILWVESLGIARHTKKKTQAEKLIKYLMSPEGQVKLARRSTYISSPTSLLAVNMLNSEERDLRGLQDRKAMDELLNKVKVRSLPTDQNQWDQIWAEFVNPSIAK